MEKLEALKQRKEQLLLEIEIADLERKQKFAQTTARWSWWWLIPLGAFGVLFALTGLVRFSGDTSALQMTVGLIALSPIGLKLFSLRSYQFRK